MKRVIVLTLLLLAIVSPANAEYKSQISYHDWDATPLSFGLAYVLDNDGEIAASLSSASLVNGTLRKDSERWFFTYSPNNDISWRLGAVYTRTVDLSQDSDGWKRDDSKTSVRPLVGVSLIRPIAHDLELRLQADVFRTHDNAEVGSRVVAEAFYKGLVIGYTSDTDEVYSGAHIAYEFHIF